MLARSFFAWRLLAAAQSQDEHNQLRRTRKQFRRRFNPVEDLSDVEFSNRYRLTKEAFQYLCQILEHHSNLKDTQQISLQEKVLVALFFFACGSYQRPVGVAKSVSQKMCSVYIQEITQALTCPAVLNKYIHFPSTRSARQAVSHKFYVKYGLPGVIGCIDGSHFKIFTPHHKEEHLYYCRKHYHSINVQMVCDSEYRIINVNAKFGGNNHDAFVWENSDLNGYMQSLHAQGELCWMLGDSGYPQRPWLMTPFMGVTPESPEAIYNQKHMTARVVIENTFGRLKNRWRCLSKDRVLHYKPEKCAKIIQACCVLYNIALQFKVPEPECSGSIIKISVQFYVCTNCEVFKYGVSARSQLPQPMEVNTEDGTSNDLLRGRAYRDQLVLRLHNESRL